MVSNKLKLSEDLQKFHNKCMFYIRVIFQQYKVIPKYDTLAGVMKHENKDLCESIGEELTECTLKKVHKEWVRFYSLYQAYKKSSYRRKPKQPSYMTKESNPIAV